MVEKSTDFGATFVPWHYLVTSPASRQCSARFGVQALQPSVIIGVGQVLCMEYKRYVPPEYNETVSFDLKKVFFCLSLISHLLLSKAVFLTGMFRQ